MVSRPTVQRMMLDVFQPNLKKPGGNRYYAAIFML